MENKTTKSLGLWLNTNRDGEKYFSGKTSRRDIWALLESAGSDEVWVNIVKNKFANSPKSPQYKLLVKPVQPKGALYGQKKDSGSNDNEEETFF